MALMNEAVRGYFTAVRELYPYDDTTFINAYPASKLPSPPSSYAALVSLESEREKESFIGRNELSSPVWVEELMLRIRLCAPMKADERELAVRAERLKEAARAAMECSSVFDISGLVLSKAKYDAKERCMYRDIDIIAEAECSEGDENDS